MLTDRQNKFLLRMIDLSQETSTATYKERIYIKRSVDAIQNGLKFQDGINAMNLSLKGWKERKKIELTPDVKNLTEELIAIYGEPDYRLGGVTSGTSQGMDIGLSIINS